MMKYLEKLLISVIIYFSTANAQHCQVIKSKHLVIVHEKIISCAKAYQAKCSWFSQDYCTFYQIDQCTQQVNRTEVVYYLEDVCCKGSIADPNGKCAVATSVDVAHCKDEDRNCALLQASLNICSNIETASALCRSTCNLCDVTSPSGQTATPFHTSHIATPFATSLPTTTQESTTSTPTMTTTADCLDEFEAEVCQFLKPQCSMPDIIQKCQRSCGYCGKMLPQSTTRSPFTYSAGTVPHVTASATVSTTTASILTLAPSSAPCSGECCDEIASDFCVVLNQCAYFNVASKCRQTCGLCTDTTTQSTV